METYLKIHAEVFLHVSLVGEQFLKTDGHVLNENKFLDLIISSKATDGHHFGEVVH